MIIFAATRNQSLSGVKADSKPPDGAGGTRSSTTPRALSSARSPPPTSKTSPASKAEQRIPPSPPGNVLLRHFEDVSIFRGCSGMAKCIICVGMCVGAYMSACVFVSVKVGGVRCCHLRGSKSKCASPSTHSRCICTKTHRAGDCGVPAG